MTKLKTTKTKTKLKTYTQQLPESQMLMRERILSVNLWILHRTQKSCDNQTEMSMFDWQNVITNKRFCIM